MSVYKGIIKDLQAQKPDTLGFSFDNLIGKRKVDPTIANGAISEYAKSADANIDTLNIMKDNAGGSGLLGAWDDIGGLSGLGQIAGLGTDIFGIMNQNKALKQAKTAWEAENSRANEIMAMNKEKYETFKADKAKLNAGY